MKIISKYKDYYDYMVSKYGLDEHIIYDRREFYTPKFYNRITKFLICGYYIDILYYNDNFYFGNEIKNLDIFVDDPFSTKFIKNEDYFKIKDQYSSYTYILNKPVHYTKMKDVTIDFNEKYDCPVLIADNYINHSQTFTKNPILSYYNFNKIYDAEQIWNMIYQWFMDKKKENFTDNRTDKDKILNKGFDLITSFRNIK